MEGEGKALAGYNVRELLGHKRRVRAVLKMNCSINFAAKPAIWTYVATHPHREGLHARMEWQRQEVSIR